jgi:hypothetical protein
MVKQLALPMSVLIGLFFSVAVSAEPVARVFYASGGVSAQRGDQFIPLENGTVIQSGDIILTDYDGAAQWQTSDGSLFAVGRDSTFKITPTRAAAGLASTNEQALYNLNSGAYRSLTAAHLDGRPSAGYKVQTPLADVKVNGTDYILVQCSKGSCKGPDGKAAPDALYAKLSAGAIRLCNSGGCVSPAINQFVTVSCKNCKPTVSDAPPIDFGHFEIAFAFRSDIAGEHNLRVDFSGCRSAAGQVPGSACAPNPTPAVSVSPN